MPPYYNYYFPVTKTIIFDTTDKTNILKLRELQIEGNSVSTRKIGNLYYQVSQRGFNPYNYYYYYYYYYYAYDKTAATPAYLDSVQGNTYIPIDYSQIYYFPGMADRQYLMISALDITKLEPVSMKTYLGSGSQIMMTLDNLYVVAPSYYRPIPTPLPGSPIQIMPLPSGEQSTVYKFAVEGTNLNYSNKGIVPGYTLNQFSMDEYNGNFRIATTTSSFTRANHLYILDKDMQICGALQNLAPGETIRSVRFMGERAVIVTFRTVDPLFAIDVKDPTKPYVMGILKIPGFSTYLHPYDENHLIGFGQNADPVTGQSLGLKLSMFDMTDFLNPREMFTEKIGFRGTSSPLLSNHKAMLFSKEKNLFAFPVNLYEQTPDYYYPTFTYQGAYVYNVDLNTGFKLRGRISHIPDGVSPTTTPYYYTNFVERILYIKEALYTISKGKYKINHMDDLRALNEISVTLPK
jgi:hypothetical protein